MNSPTQLAIRVPVPTEGSTDDKHRRASLFEPQVRRRRRLLGLGCASQPATHVGRDSDTP